MLPSFAIVEGEGWGRGRRGRQPNTAADGDGKRAR